MHTMQAFVGICRRPLMKTSDAAWWPAQSCGAVAASAKKATRQAHVAFLKPTQVASFQEEGLQAAYQGVCHYAQEDAALGREVDVRGSEERFIVIEALVRGLYVR